MKQNPKLINLLDAKTPIAESYRSLQTNIEFAGTDKKMKLICITSPGASEGKSTTCANLALTYAQTKHRVLLIDADLRCPAQHRLFNLSNSKGLSNVVAFKEELSETIYEVSEEFHVLTTGPLPPNPIEMIRSKSMKQFLELVRNSYDVIIIDTPPVGILTDASLIAAESDGTLLVVASGKSLIDLTKKAHENLNFVGAHLIGTLMTMLPVDNQSYKYYVQTYEEDIKPAKSRKEWFKRKGCRA